MIGLKQGKENERDDRLPAFHITIPEDPTVIYNERYMVHFKDESTFFYRFCMFSTPRETMFVDTRRPRPPQRRPLGLLPRGQAAAQAPAAAAQAPPAQAAAPPAQAAAAAPPAVPPVPGVQPPAKPLTKLPQMALEANKEQIQSTKPREWGRGGKSRRKTRRSRRTRRR